MEELEANINNIPKWLPDEAISWRDSTAASVDDNNIITKTTTRVWKLPGGKTIEWVKVDTREVELQAQESEIEDIDFEEFEKEFQAKLDLAAKHTLEKTLLRMVKAKKKEVVEELRLKEEQMANIRMRFSGFLKRKQAEHKIKNQLALAIR